MPNNPELEEWDSINSNGGTIGTGINRAIHKLVLAIFNAGFKTSTQVEHLGDKIDELNENLKDASRSSNNLARSLNWLTFFGVLVALISIISQLVQFLYSNHLL